MRGPIVSNHGARTGTEPLHLHRADWHLLRQQAAINRPHSFGKWRLTRPFQSLLRPFQRIRFQLMHARDADLQNLCDFGQVQFLDEI